MAMETKQNDKILDVKNLRISFRTDGGTVKAVRGISFSLYKGKTLAIVGESGSGKSVTSKAILGILAGNKIIEDGQILYDGKDLLQINEDQFSKIRGVKISMIFQDPLSSLNPIMIVGKQLTEAMVLKQKADKKEAKRHLTKLNALIKKADPDETNLLLIEQKEGRFSIEQHRDLFLHAAEISVDEQKETIENILPKLENVYQEHFNKEDFDFGKAFAALKPLFKDLAKCELSISTSPDNIISVFPIQAKNYVAAAKDSLAHEKLREKNFVKYGVNDFFDLPASVRAKSRETIISQKEHQTHFQAAFEELLEHLKELLRRTAEETAEIGEEAIVSYNEAIKISESELTHKEAKERAIKMLADVGINEPEKRYNQYPFELSGGMRQRIVIAIALCSSPEILICDEPTTALDVTIQSQILELINRLKVEKNLSIVFITHDLGVVANMADDIAVMYAGKIVEKGTATDIFYDPRHPYTWALLGSVPDLNTKEKLNAIPGTPPNMLLPPRGDAFAARNKDALEIDHLYQPPFFQVSPTHVAATWNLHPEAEDIKAPALVITRIKNALKEHPEYTPKADNMKNSVLNYIKEDK